MPFTSKRVRRLEKEAILRSKEYEYTRERSEHLLSSVRRNSEDDENERQRRQITTRPIRQIQRDADYQLEMIEKLNELKQQELKRKQALATTASTQNYLTTSSTPSSSSFVADRASRSSAVTEKYTSSKRTSGGKLY